MTPPCHRSRYLRSTLLAAPILSLLFTSPIRKIDYLGGRFLAALSINAALLFGLGQSTLNANWYNGGLENFPRFLESWDNRTLNYRGSFVSLGDSQHKKADWACGSGNDCYGSGVYDPPERNYDYEADFNTVEKLPPQTPKIVYVQQLLYTRIYN